MNEPSEIKTGWRCAVCTHCGWCFEAESDVATRWTGVRCDECTGCGKCMEAWGLTGDEADGESGPTNWADAFKAMDDGNRGAPPKLTGAPGVM